MPFWDIDTDQDRAQQARQQTGSQAAQADPDIQNALRGVYTGKYADLARQLPAAWPAAVRNAQVAQSIAYDKGIDTSGLDSSNQFSVTNTGTPFAVQIAPYVIGGIAGAGAAGAFGGGAGGASAASGAGTGGLVGSGEATVLSAPLTAAQAGYAGSLSSVAAGAGGGGAGWGSTLGQILRGATGTSGGQMGTYGWLAPVLNTGLNLYGQSRQLSANQDALNQQLASTKYATDAQMKAQAEQLAFLRQQAGYDATVAEANRAGNYGQWAAKQAQLGTVGQALGLPARAIPAYVPLPAYNPSGAPGPAPLAGTPGPNGMVRVGDQLIDPASPLVGGPGRAALPNGGVPGAGAAGGGPAPVNAGAGPIAPQVAAYFAARGVTPNPTSVDYWAQKWTEFGANDPAYFNQRLAAADEFGGGAPTPAAPARRYLPMTNLLGPVQDYLVDPTTGGQLRMPIARPPYGGAVGSYV